MKMDKGTTLRPNYEPQTLRATASKYGESHDSSENWDFILLRQKDPFGELFSKIHIQSSSEFTFLWNLGKFEAQSSKIVHF